MVNFSKKYNIDFFPVCLAGSIDTDKEEMKLCTNWEEEFSSFDKINININIERETFSVLVNLHVSNINTKDKQHLPKTKT